MNLSICDSVDIELLENDLSTVSDRYYEHRYCLKIQSECSDVHHRVSFHSNRICLLSLADNHPIIKENKHISKIDYDVYNNNNTDKLKNKMSGKGKRGAQKVAFDTVICIIQCSDNTIYPVYSCIRGKLIELNDKLLNDPNLLKEKPITDGYIALLLPVLSTYDDIKNSMMTSKEYFSLTT